MGKNDMERLALQELGENEPAPAVEDLKKVFNINKNQTLPDDFDNPPCGEPGHHCLNQNNQYQPDWFQLKIFKAFPHQADPQSFPLGVPYSVPLDEWVDVPPGIIESLKSAVETHHEFYAEAPELRPGQIVFGGQKALPKAKERPRFMYQFLPSK